MPSPCFKAVPVLRDCRIHDSILELARFGHFDIVSEKALFLSIFYVIPIEMVWIQFEEFEENGEI